MSDKKLPQRTLKEYIILSLYGFAMGTANVIPGVSGGTMAFLLGIYEELIESIRAFASLDTIKLAMRFKIKELLVLLPWKFMLMLGIGVLIAFGSLAKFLTWCLDKHEVLTFAFFFGLVIASIVTVLKRVKKWSFGAFVSLVLGAAVAYFIVTLVPVETAHTPLNLFICGMIIICAMILPGISGSFLLLVLGQYKYVLAAVTNHSPSDLLTLFWVAAGCGVGLGSFVHLLNWLFKKFHDLTIATLIGFMVGSLWKLWPWHNTTLAGLKKGGEYIELALPADQAQYLLKVADGWKVKPLVQNNILPQNIDANFWYAVGLAVLGFVVVIIMETLASKRLTVNGKR
jgi:putative membrane protein